MAHSERWIRPSKMHCSANDKLHHKYCITSSNAGKGKVVKSEQSKFCGRQPLKNLLSPLLNTLSQIFVATLRLNDALHHQRCIKCSRCLRNAKLYTRVLSNQTPHLLELYHTALKYIPFWNIFSNSYSSSKISNIIFLFSKVRNEFNFWVLF